MEVWPAGCREMSISGFATTEAMNTCSLKTTSPLFPWYMGAINSGFKYLLPTLSISEQIPHPALHHFFLTDLYVTWSSLTITHQPSLLSSSSWYSSLHYKHLCSFWSPVCIPIRWYDMYTQWSLLVHEMTEDPGGRNGVRVLCVIISLESGGQAADFFGPQR